MRQLIFILALFLTHALSAQNAVMTPKPLTDMEQLSWNGVYHYKTNPYDTLYGFYTFHLRSLNYSLNGVLVWTINLPERMQSYEAQSMYDRTTDSSGGARKLAEHEIDVNKFYFKELSIFSSIISFDSRDHK